MGEATGEQLAKEIQKEFEAVMEMMDLHGKTNLVVSTQGPWVKWNISYAIQVYGHTHSNSVTVVAEHATMDTVGTPGNKVIDFREPTMKRAFGDLGRGLLDIYRKQQKQIEEDMS